MTQQLGLRFLPQCTFIRSSLQRVCRGFVGLEIQPMIARLHRTVANFSWFFADPRANSIHLMQRVVRQDQPFRRNMEPEQSNRSWLVLLAVALAAATLANKKSEAEEAELSWDEVEQIAYLFDVALPQTRTPEDLKRASQKCFNVVFQACLEGDWTLIDQVSTATLSKLTNTWGQTLLIAAAGEGNEGAVKGLLNRKIALTKRDREGNTPLHATAKNGYAHLVPLLWNRYATDLNNQKKNAYHLAIEYGHLAVLQVLISKKPKTESLEENNLTLPLLALCVRYSRKSCLDYLLEQSDYHLKEEIPRLGTLLHVAIYFGQFNMLKHLVSRPEAASLFQILDKKGRNPLALAAFLGDLEAVEFLCHKIGDSKGHLGRTAAHWAVIGEQGEVLELLDYLGMSLTTYDSEGKRPEDFSKDIRMKNILTGLLQNKDKVKQSPLDFRSHPPEGIVFKGGGPRGLAYLEALRALKEKNTLKDVRKTAGTSAGAITAAIFALDPNLQDIDSLEKLDLKRFLDPVPGKEPLLQAMLTAKDKEGTLSKIASGGFEFVKGAWNPFSFYNAFSQLDGICKGEELRQWTESEISRRTGIKNCTFGDLKREIQKGKKYLHLHVYITRLEADPEHRILHLSSEDPKWDNIVISDAIRASMSIPGIYQPYILREKTAFGTLNPRHDLGLCVDGGLLKNFPLDAFDVSTDHNYSEFNKRTLGLCLKDINDKATQTPPVNGIVDILQTCASVYWASQESYIATEENRHRTIEIPIRGVGLCDFNLTDEQKANLLKGGREGIENSVFAKARGEPGLLVHLKASNVPTRLPSFTGRQEELHTLEKTFISDPPPPNETIVRLIYGLGGMGKTELTRAFILDYQHDFSITWFINSASPEMRNQSYRELAEKLNISILDKEPPEQIERKVHNHLKNHSYEKPWLLIYDNVEKEFIPPQGGYILMTSRKKEVWKNEKERIYLDGFTPAVSIKILQDITQKQSPRMAELAQVLGHFPLAINQVAHYIRSANCSIEDYLTELNKNPARGKMEPSARYTATLQNVWQLTLEKLEQENPKASAWLKICAHLNPDDIPQEWLSDWLKTQPGGANDWGQMEIMRTLGNLSLIRTKGDGYSMHRLLQLVIRGSEDARNGFEEAFSLVISHQKNSAPWKQAEKWVSQAVSLEQSHFFLRIDEKKQTNLLSEMGAIFTELGEYYKSCEYDKRVVEIREKKLDFNDLDLAIGYQRLAGSLEDLGKYEEALEYDKKAMEIREKTLDPQDLLLETSYNNVGRSLANLGRHQKALEYFQKAKKINKKRSPDDDDLSIIYRNIASSLHCLNQHPEGKEYNEKALKVMQKQSNIDDRKLAACYTGLGNSLGHLGWYHKSLDFHLKALEIREKSLSPNHGNLALSHNNVGLSLSNLGQHGKALEHHQKSLEILASRERHPSQEAYLKNFTISLSQQSDKELCEKAKQKILAPYTEKLGEDHPLIKELNKACPKGWLRWPF